MKCECGHELTQHTYSEDYVGCDVDFCKCTERITDAYEAELAQLRQRAETLERDDKLNEETIANLQAQLDERDEEYLAARNNAATMRAALQNYVNAHNISYEKDGVLYVRASAHEAAKSALAATGEKR